MVSRVIIIHTLDDAKTALSVAAALNTPITLQSAPDALFYAGSLYLWHLFEQARQAFPHVPALCILDGADAKAEILAAMQVGHKHIRLQQPDAKIQDIAAQNGVALYTEPYEALDLRKVRDTKDACQHWLEQPHENHTAHR